MSKLLEPILVAIAALLMVFVLCVFSGTFIWLIYPHIHALFPTAAENGIISQELKWWDAVCVTWLFTILFKSSIKSNDKK